MDAIFIWLSQLSEDRLVESDGYKNKCEDGALLETDAGNVEILA